MSKPSIWIDLTHLNEWQGRFTGIERVEYELASRFAGRPDVKFFLYQPLRRSFVEVPKTYLGRFAEHTGGHASASTARRALSGRVGRKAKKLLKRVLGMNAPRGDVSTPLAAGDLVLVTGTNGNINFMRDLVEAKRSTGFKLSHIIYDLVPIVNPAFVPDGISEHFKAYYGLFLPEASGALAISESSKRDVEAFCKELSIKPPPVQVFRLGDNLAVTAPKRPAELPKEYEGYALYVSTIEVRKNHALLYYAYHLARQEGVSMPPMVIVGRPGWLAGDILRLIKHDPVTKGRFVVLESVDDAGLAWLYENCRFTVFPSYYEGWGLPIAESLRYGKLCLASNTSSMPEVAGDLAEYFSPYDVRACMEKIAAYANDPKALRAKEAEIKSRYQAKTWDDAYAYASAFVEGLTARR